MRKLLLLCVLFHSINVIAVTLKCPLPQLLEFKDGQYIYAPVPSSPYYPAGKWVTAYDTRRPSQPRQNIRLYATIGASTTEVMRERRIFDGILSNAHNYNILCVYTSSDFPGTFWLTAPDIRKSSAVNEENWHTDNQRSDWLFPSACYANQTSCLFNVGFY